MVADIEGGKEAEGVREQGAEENIWAYEGRGNKGVEKTTQKEEHNDLHCSPNIRVNKSMKRWARHVARTRYSRVAYTFSVGRPGVGGRMRTWEDNIKMDLHEVGWRHGLDWFSSLYRHMAKACECGNESSGSMKCVEGLDCLRTC